MKSFKNFLKEDYELPLAHITPDGKHEEFVTKNLKHQETLDEINVQLRRATFGQFSNPYQPLNSVSKLLATYGIQIPRPYFPAVDAGEMIWSVASTGQLYDYNTNNSSASMTPSGYYVYFEYGVDMTGAYIAYAEIVDEAGLNDMMEDLDEDIIDETLDKNAKASDYIQDFVKSKNKKFKGDSKKKRIERALGAYYSKNEDLKTIQGRNAASKDAMAKALAAIGNIKKEPDKHDPKYEAFKKQKEETRKTDDRLLKNVKARQKYHSTSRF